MSIQTSAARSFSADVNRRLTFGTVRQSTIGATAVTHTIIRRRASVGASV
jgi:hypothetical protein